LIQRAEPHLDAVEAVVDARLLQQRRAKGPKHPHRRSRALRVLLGGEAMEKGEAAKNKGGA
jgi:hypothetical protein